MYAVHLPGGEWINLAEMRRCEVEEDPPCILLEFTNGDSKIYRDEKAITIIEALNETTTIDKSHIRIDP